jgi:hypothetical protein
MDCDRDERDESAIIPEQLAGELSVNAAIKEIAIWHYARDGGDIPLDKVVELLEAWFQLYACVDHTSDVRTMVALSGRTMDDVNIFINRFPDCILRFDGHTTITLDRVFEFITNFGKNGPIKQVFQDVMDKITQMIE